MRIETDRYICPPIPEQQRICLNCDKNKLENEIHFALHCSKYKQLRQTLMNKLSIDSTLQDKEIVKLLVSDTKNVKLFSQFIIDCLDIRDS